MLNNCDLEIWVRGHSSSRSFELVGLPFERLGAISYSPSS